MRPPAGSGRLWLVAAGFIAWSAAFVLLYGTQALGCRLGWHEAQAAFGLSLQRVVLIVLFIVLLAGVAALAGWLAAADHRLRDGSEAGAFLARLGRDAGLAALAATAITFGWVFWLSAC